MSEVHNDGRITSWWPARCSIHSWSEGNSCGVLCSHEINWSCV